jgi:hypothetical protein
MKGKLLTCLALSMLLGVRGWASKLLIAMDESGQTNHLKAYGVVFQAIKTGNMDVEWLLNYKGGSFVMEYTQGMAHLCGDRHVAYSNISTTEYEQILKTIDKDFNMAAVKLTQAPRIAVYTPANKAPWDDAVTMALTYAEIPFDKVYIDEVLNGKLKNYDWLHLHHEDFTGQYGKFWASFHGTGWYEQEVKSQKFFARENGYDKVSKMQLAVVKKISSFVNKGGNMFAMCSATDTYDIALAAAGTDICDTMFDGDPPAPDAQKKLDFTRCLAFTNFTIIQSPYIYEYSDIDNTNFRNISFALDYFTLHPQPAKFDAIGAMLCQNHTNTIKGFMGQTTAFRNGVLKPGVQVLADNTQAGEARYIHGSYGSGSWTFYGGHDPEDYQHAVGDSATDLSRFPNSPGYRLILNNVLFPAARQKVMPTVVYNDPATRTAPTPAPVAPMEQQVKITPNPSDGTLDINIATGTIKDIVIIAASGKEVFRKIYNGRTAKVDMSVLPAGMFMIQVNGEYAGKVVKN